MYLIDMVIVGILFQIKTVKVNFLPLQLNVVTYYNLNTYTYINTQKLIFSFHLHLLCSTAAARSSVCLW